MLKASNLPKILIVNPRSVYNKVIQLKSFIKEHNLDLVCLSETWERVDEPLSKILAIKDYEIISNNFSRRGVGGRPAILVNTSRYNVENITQNVAQIPWTLEIVWAILTPKNLTNKSEVKKIVVASYYCKPGIKRKKLLYDHISTIYHFISSKHTSGLYWCIAGDSNQLNLDPLINLNPKFKQVVDQPTRLSPPRILDTIVTDLHILYQSVECVDPLDVDLDKPGTASDHKMVIFTPLNNAHNVVKRIKKRIDYRPYTDKGFAEMTKVLDNFCWDSIENMNDANKQLATFQQIVYNMFDNCFPSKSQEITTENELWFNEKLSKLKKRKSREFNKNRRSSKYMRLQKVYKQQLSESKRLFYRNKVRQLKSSDSKQWWRKMKKLTKCDNTAEEQVQVAELKDFSDKEQVEIIAKSFAQISQEFQPLNRDEIQYPSFNEHDFPTISETDVLRVLEDLNISKSERKGDIPARILKHFSKYFSKPIAAILNNSIRKGVWAEFQKVELVTPIGKVSNPKTVKDLRPISCLMTITKIMEKIVCKYVVNDLKNNLDISQFAGQKGLSTEHYLVKMIDRILGYLDRNSTDESCAVLTTFLDFSQAFNRVDHTLMMKSFIRNGVRPSLLPFISNYFENRTMVVKWHNHFSESYHLPGSSAQGSTFGVIGFISITNDNLNCVPEDDRWKYMDDSSICEKINLQKIGLASHNLKIHVPSNIPVHNQIVKNVNLKTQKYLNEINIWTDSMKMKLNENKTNAMIFNNTKNYQFTSDLSLKGKTLDIVDEVKLLGVIISNDLKWDKHVQKIVKEANIRMKILYTASKFTKSIGDLKKIYIAFIRSKLEYACTVWHSNLTNENRSDIERIQKCAFKIILGKYYTSYENALDKLNMKTLNERRQTLCLNFAKKGLKIKAMQKLFPKYTNKHNMKTRNGMKYVVNFAKSKKYFNSSIPYFQKLLNKEERDKGKLIKNISI